MRDLRPTAVISCSLSFALACAVVAGLCSIGCGPAAQQSAGDVAGDDGADDVGDVDDVGEDGEVEGDVDDGAALLEEAVVDVVDDGAAKDDVAADDAADEAADDAANDGDIAVDDVAVDDGGATTDDASAQATTPATTTPRAVTRTVRVLQWNIAGGKENACQAPLITRAVRRYVHAHDTDFVSLNEVCPSQYRAIKEALRQEWGKPRGVVFSAYVGDDGGRIVGDAIFSKRRLDVISKLHLGHDQFGQRWLLCGRVAAKHHLRLCSAHTTPGDATARLQVARIHDQIEQWWSERRDTVVLAGDLNLNADDRGLNNMYSAAADTAHNGDNHGRYRELDDDDGQNCRGYGERSHAGHAGPCHTGGKIDFIFARQNRIVDGDYSADTLDIPNDCTGACSDHRAEVGHATLRVRVE